MTQTVTRTWTDGGVTRCVMVTFTMENRHRAHELFEREIVDEVRAWTEALDPCGEIPLTLSPYTRTVSMSRDHA